MCLDHPMDDRQAEARSFILGGKKWIENFVHDFGEIPGPRIFDVEAELFSVIGIDRKFHHHPPHRFDCLHGIQN